MVWVSNLLLAPQSAKLKLKWFKAFNTREFFVISLLHTSSLIRSHTHTITTRNAISVPKLFHLSWIFSFSFKDVSQWKQSKSGLRIEIHYVWKNGTEWHENKSKSGTFYDLRAIFFLARRPTHDLYSRLCWDDIQHLLPQTKKYTIKTTTHTHIKHLRRHPILLFNPSVRCCCVCVYIQIPLTDSQTHSLSREKFETILISNFLTAKKKKKSLINQTSSHEILQRKKFKANHVWYYYKQCIHY